MSCPTSVNSTTAGGVAHPCFDKPTVRILIYTDDPERVTDVGIGNFSLSHMIRSLHEHEPAFAKVCFNLVSRNSNRQSHADNTLDRVLPAWRLRGARGTRPAGAVQ